MRFMWNKSRIRVTKQKTQNFQHDGRYEASSLILQGKEQYFRGYEVCQKSG